MSRSRPTFSSRAMGTWVDCFRRFSRISSPRRGKRKQRPPERNNDENLYPVIRDSAHHHGGNRVEATGGAIQRLAHFFGREASAQRSPAHGGRHQTGSPPVAPRYAASVSIDTGYISL